MRKTKGTRWTAVLAVAVVAATGWASASSPATSAVVPSPGFDPYPPTKDIGFGTRAGGNPCNAAVVVLAAAHSLDEEGLVDIRVIGGPAQDLVFVPECGWTGKWVTGSIEAKVAGTAAVTRACVNNLNPGPGGWLQGSGACQLGGFSAAMVVGHVFHLEYKFCNWPGDCWHIEALVGGVPGWTASPAGDSDTATVVLAA